MTQGHSDRINGSRRGSTTSQVPGNTRSTIVGPGGKLISTAKQHTRSTQSKNPKSR